MSAQDRLANRLKSMKKTKLVGKKDPKQYDMENPAPKKEDSESNVVVEGGGGSKRQSASVKYNDGNIKAGISGSSKSGKKNKIRSAFASKKLGDGVSVGATYNEYSGKDNPKNDDDIARISFSKKF